MDNSPHVILSFKRTGSTLAAQLLHQCNEHSVSIPGGEPTRSYEYFYPYCSRDVFQQERYIPNEVYKSHKFKKHKLVDDSIIRSGDILSDRIDENYQDLMHILLSLPRHKLPQFKVMIPLVKDYFIDFLINELGYKPITIYRDPYEIYLSSALSFVTNKWHIGKDKKLQNMHQINELDTNHASDFLIRYNDYMSYVSDYCDVVLDYDRMISDYNYVPQSLGYTSIMDEKLINTMPVYTSNKVDYFNDETKEALENEWNRIREQLSPFPGNTRKV